MYNAKPMVKKMRFKKTFILLLCSLLSGCAGQSSGLQIFSRLFGGTPETVKVQKGDTLYSIAKRYDMSISELIELNGIDSPNQLYVGQVLKTTSAKSYVVKRGDTLASIARRHQTTYQDLAKQNNLKAPYHLNVGQKLTINGQKENTASSAGQKTTANAKKSTTSAASQSTTSVSTKRSAKFVWPVSGKVISTFGATGKGRKNDGINISAPLGTAVKAGDKGVVAYAGNGLKGFGNLILIKHPDGYITAYAHTDQMLVKKGQNVARGEKIATVGKTGGVTTPQLHFEVRAGKKAVNPKNYLP